MNTKQKLKNNVVQLDFALSPKQAYCFNSPATEILFGGAAGGGKSYLMRVTAIAWCLEIPRLSCWLFRKLAVDLVDTHLNGPGGFREMLASLVEAGKVKITTHPLIDIQFLENGSSIRLRHAQDMDGVRSKEFHVLLLDELTEFTEDEYRFLRSRVRMDLISQKALPEKYKGRFPRILNSSNPTGIGHQFVKGTFVDPVPYNKLWRTPKREGGFIRQYIPSLLTDNPYLDAEAYAAALSGIGSPELVKAMLDGNWDVVAGSALEKLTRRLHEVRPFTPPRHWTKIMAMDWGTAKPFSIGWYCVVEGETLIKGLDGGEDKSLPDGALVRYREWYGWNGKADTGCRMESIEVAERILEIEEELDEKIDARIADNSMWAQVDGPSVAERMMSVRSDRGGKLVLTQCVKNRTDNYQEVRFRIAGEDGRSMFYVTSNCTHFWRTVPSLQLDELHPEKGWDTKMEDHCADEMGYCFMSRPMKRSKIQREQADYQKYKSEVNGDRATSSYSFRKGSRRG